MAEDDLEKHLVEFAMDQIAVIGGWRGKRYVRDCLEVWRREYGERVASSVANAVSGALLKRRGKA